MRGLDFDLCARRQAAEKIHNSAAADHRESHFPSRRIAGSFYDTICTAVAIGEGFDRGSNVFGFRDVDRGNCAEAASDIERGSTASERNDANTATREHSNEFQSNG